MVAQRMGSQGGGGNSIGETQAQTRIQTHDPKSNQLSKQGSLYSLTLDEVQTQLGDLGKPFNSMNLDELLKTVFTAEERVDPMQPGSGPSLERDASVMFSKDLSKKTVDEVWTDIQQEQKKTSLERNVTLGEMTLEDFLVKAGVVAESAKNPSSITNTGSVTAGVDPIGLSQQAQWMNYQIPPQPVYMPPSQLGGNPGMENAYHDTQIMSSSDNQTPRRKRVAPDGVVEKSVERRQKRMIKNRESAARSRARKQAYTHELENKVSLLEEENERLKRQKEWEKALLIIPPPQAPKCQLRRTSSSPM